MDDLDAQLGEELAKAVMEDCGRECIGSSVLAKALQIHAQATDLDDLLARLNQAHLGGGSLRREGELVYASYSRCYCGAVSKVRQPISASYCQCSCGWYARLFETLLHRPVRVELIDSIAHGADACNFVIHM
jgi:predicted hydrocarbon binding protein